MNNKGSQLKSNLKKRPKTSGDRPYVDQAVNALVKPEGTHEMVRPKTSFTPYRKNIADLKRARSAIRSRSSPSNKHVTFSETKRAPGELDIRVRAKIPLGPTDQENEAPNTTHGIASAEDKIIEYYRAVVSNSSKYLQQLNSHPRLCGIKFKNICIGSLVITANCNTLRSLVHLETEFKSGGLLSVFHEIFTADKQLENDLGLNSLKLEVNIKEEELKKCRDDLLQKTVWDNISQLNYTQSDSTFVSRQDCVQVLQKLHSKITATYVYITQRYQEVTNTHMSELFMVLKLTKCIQTKIFCKLADVNNCQEYVNNSPSVGKSVNAQLLEEYLHVISNIKTVNSEVYNVLNQWEQHISRYIDVGCLDGVKKAYEYVFMCLDPEMCFCDMSTDGVVLVDIAMSVMDKHMFAELAKYVPVLLVHLEKVISAVKQLIDKLSFAIKTSADNKQPTALGNNQIPQENNTSNRVTDSNNGGNLQSMNSVSEKSSTNNHRNSYTSGQLNIDSVTDERVSDSITDSVDTADLDDFVPRQNPEKAQLLSDRITRNGQMHRDDIDSIVVGSASPKDDERQNRLAREKEHTSGTINNTQAATSENLRLTNKNGVGNLHSTNTNITISRHTTPEGLEHLNKNHTDESYNIGKGKNTSVKSREIIYFPKEKEMFNVSKIPLTSSAVSGGQIRMQQSKNENILTKSGFEKQQITKIDYNSSDKNKGHYDDTSTGNYDDTTIADKEKDSIIGPHKKSEVNETWNASHKTDVTEHSTCNKCSLYQIGHSIPESFIHVKHVIFDEERCVRGPHYRHPIFKVNTSPTVNRRFMLMKQMKQKDNRAHRSNGLSVSAVSLSSSSTYDFQSSSSINFTNNDQSIHRPNMTKRKIKSSTSLSSLSLFDFKQNESAVSISDNENVSQQHASLSKKININKLQHVPLTSAQVSLYKAKYNQENNIEPSNRPQRFKSASFSHTKLSNQETRVLIRPSSCSVAKFEQHGHQQDRNTSDKRHVSFNKGISNPAQYMYKLDPEHESLLTKSSGGNSSVCSAYDWGAPKDALHLQIQKAFRKKSQR